MSTHEQLQSENKTLHTDLRALTATISSQGARIAELEEKLSSAVTSADRMYDAIIKYSKDDHLSFGEDIEATEAYHAFMASYGDKA